MQDQPDDRTGPPPSVACSTGSVYFASINECVDAAVTVLPVFAASFSAGKTCAGGLVTSQSDLEALRFCTYITSSLTIAVDDPNADFSPLFDIASISGL